MTAVEYRVFFNNNPAPREQLDRIEELTVEQEIDMAWEARIQIPIGTDANGNWSGEDEEFMQPFTPVRIEIKVGDGNFVPLIDGPIVNADSGMSTEPGQSMLTLTVQDNSVFLNREDSIFRFENLLDHEIASQIFGEAEQITSTDIEETPSPTSGSTPVVVQRGTEMQLLRFLARRQGMHAYVLPGDAPGASVGCFKTFPTEPDGLPLLTLTGSDRNLTSFNPRTNAQRPARVTAYSVSLLDKTITRSTSSFDSLDLLGEEQSFQQAENTANQILCPSSEDAVDLDRAVQAEALNSSFATEVTGSIMSDCYAGVLTPYRIVTVSGVNRRQSGNYLIHQVTHQLTRSGYSQSFTLKRNARSQGAGASPTDLARTIS